MANTGEIILIIFFTFILIIMVGGGFLIYELDKDYRKADGACVKNKGNGDCTCDVFTPKDECESNKGKFYANKDCEGLCPNNN